MPTTREVIIGVGDEEDRIQLLTEDASLRAYLNDDGTVEIQAVSHAPIPPTFTAEDMLWFSTALAAWLADDLTALPESADEQPDSVDAWPDDESVDPYDPYDDVVSEEIESLDGYNEWAARGRPDFFTEGD